MADLRRSAQEAVLWALNTDPVARLRETKRRKCAKCLYLYGFLGSSKNYGCFTWRSVWVGGSVENSSGSVLRVLEVNTFEPLVKNVNATAQPYVARVSGREGEVLRESR